LRCNVFAAVQRRNCFAGGLLNGTLRKRHLPEEDPMVMIQRLDVLALCASLVLVGAVVLGFV
jgi:hypothetical protein